MTRPIRFRGALGEGLPFQQARHMGGDLAAPCLVILHDTASRIEAGSAAAYLRDNDARVSAHFVVERDGAIVQQVPLDRVAHHAGQSSYHGRRSCNNFSVGVEIVSPGRMTEAGPDRARAWWGQSFDIDTHGILWRRTREHGEGLWMPYPEAQIDAVLDLLAGLVAHLPSIRDIRAHWYVSPGRKIDTGPLFPLEAIRGRILGRDDPADEEAETGSAPEPGVRTVEVATRGGALHLRRWPSFENNIIGRIPDGRLVPVLREGLFAGRTWLRVLYAGREGWVVASHTKPA
jgi:N-acetylmuramoyl-L-alanine amidase